ncbi:MAG: hypothetical protein J6J42_08495 [Lachnospiraceae bacterium]|nr:hypothetical protein [Lachnospiraceae bacterium]
METLITLDCSNYSDNLETILKLFQQIGWTIYNSEGQAEFLPLGDQDDYDWQRQNLPENMIYNILAKKRENQEIIGINLFYEKGTEGISLLAQDTSQITLSIGINRRLLNKRHTDTIWYLQNIIYKLFDMGVRITSYTVEEFED